MGNRPNFAYLARITWKSGFFTWGLCTGSIVSPNYVLTAASCLVTRTGFVVLKNKEHSHRLNVVDW